MSNHSGSYMLNRVLTLLNREHVFDLLGKEASQRLVADIVNMAGEQYDCNSSEILDGHEVRLGLCYGCLSATDDLEDGLCVECRT